MNNTYELNQLSHLIGKERMMKRDFSRELRRVEQRRHAYRRMQREIERLIKAEGNTDSIRAMIDQLAVKLDPCTRSASQPCCRS